MTATNLPKIPREQHYRLTEPGLDMIRGQRLQPAGLRLLHALIHHTLRRSDTWFDEETPQVEKGYRARCTDLRAALGISAGNDNRALAKGLAELQASALFERIGFIHNRHWLAWRFGEVAFRYLYTGDRFGNYDARHLVGLVTPADLELHSGIMMIRRMRQPEVMYHLPILAELLHSPEPSWERNSSRILTALASIVARERAQAVLLLDAEGTLPGIDTLLLRLWYPGNTWSTKRFGKVTPFTQQVVFLDGGGWRRLKPAELPETVAGARKSSLVRPSD